jgi:hypothetical protein
MRNALAGFLAARLAGCRRLQPDPLHLRGPLPVVVRTARRGGRAKRARTPPRPPTPGPWLRRSPLGQHIVIRYI